MLAGTRRKRTVTPCRRNPSSSARAPSSSSPSLPAGGDTSSDSSRSSTAPDSLRTASTAASTGSRDTSSDTSEKPASTRRKMPSWSCPSVSGSAFDTRTGPACRKTGRAWASASATCCTVAMKRSAAPRSASGCGHMSPTTASSPRAAARSPGSIARTGTGRHGSAAGTFSSALDSSRGFSTGSREAVPSRATTLVGLSLSTLSSTFIRGRESSAPEGHRKMDVGNFVQPLACSPSREAVPMPRGSTTEATQAPSWQ